MTDTQTSEPIIATGRGFLRLQPAEAHAAQERGALFVDLRPAAVRRRDGEIPGSLVVAGPLREWRLGPASPERVCELGDRRVVVVICARGESSLLGASALYGMSVAGATDVVGGFEAWREAGLPVVVGGTPAGRFVPVPAEQRERALV
jgi:rhodanese-related sulfurtransferase